MRVCTIRFAQPADELLIQALDARVEPYRPEDHTAVEAMLARGLYQKLGFAEKAISFVGPYELVWMELGL
jgi:hypothetical protein